MYKDYAGLGTVLNCAIEDDDFSLFLQRLWGRRWRPRPTKSFERWDGFSRAEIEEAVSYSNVCNFWVPTRSEEKRSRRGEEEVEKGGADRWGPNSVLESDPDFARKVRAFRRISELHERIFFAWIDGEKVDPALISRAGLSPAQLKSRVTFGKYLRRHRPVPGQGSEAMHRALQDRTNARTPQVLSAEDRFYRERGARAKARRRLRYSGGKKTVQLAKRRRRPALNHSQILEKRSVRHSDDALPPAQLPPHHYLSACV